MITNILQNVLVNESGNIAEIYKIVSRFDYHNEVILRILLDLN